MNDQRREDMLVGALEGGSNYWYWLGDDATEIIKKYSGENDPLVIAMWKAIKAGKTIPIRDYEDRNEVIGSISMDSIVNGEMKMASEQPEHWANLVNETDDAETADVWFQFCTLGDIVYG
jgi:hypothetical protein